MRSVGASFRRRLFAGAASVSLAAAAGAHAQAQTATGGVQPATPPDALAARPAPGARAGAPATDAAPPLAASPAPDALNPMGQPEVIVTATRRETTVQSAPINISAVGSDQIEAQRLENLREITREVPGVYIPDEGPRSGSPIVFRGLNADPLGAGDGDNSGGGTVATYIGDIPIYLDLRLNDIDRVEFLAGPQGTLYGAGTLGGAIRYIPKRPQFDAPSLEVRGEGYGYSHGSDGSYNVGATVNLPITSTLAFRASFDRLDDGGFIDQPYVVNQIGVSNPDPNFSDPASVKANTHRVDGVNDDRVSSARLALRWRPAPWLDANLSYYLQRESTDGRQASGRVVSDFPVPVGDYDNLKRVLEPNTRTNELFALEVNADLGFATLTSATGRSFFRDDGHRDQTDLLIGLEYGYESFPDFTAFTTEHDQEKVITQELRLVSKQEGRFSWILGGFYNQHDTSGFSKEMTPNYSEYLVNEEGFPGPARPDELEYYSVGESRLRELAGFGEATYKLTSKWQITAGGRYYDYTLKTEQAVDIPLFDTVSGNRGPDEISLSFVPGGQKDSGFLYKFNTSYQLTRDVLFYFTASQGYRVGNSNGVAPCPDPLPVNQIVCALPNELTYQPDKTNNYEIGAKTQWFRRRLTFNAALYTIDWSDPQVASATQNGLQPITVNGAGARTRGFELLLAARPTERLSLRATYAYTEPELTDETLNLVPFITAPGFQSTLQYQNGEPGDRLPGSPHNSGSGYIEYALPLSNARTLNFSYSIYGQTDVFTTTGARGGSYILPGFTRSDIQARLVDREGGWTATLYCDNLFGDVSETGVAGSPTYNQTVADADGGTHYVRTFYSYVLAPRQVGVRFTKSFGGGRS